MLTSRIQIRSLFGAFALILASTVVTSTAVAQEIQVDTAEPNMAEQETYDLVVMVGGQNFPSDAEVDFFVTGTEDAGGITVKKVKRQGPKNLKVTIDVAPDAQFQDKFDIQVRSRRGGRSGKGTELFRVTEKEKPNQDPLPGMPTGLAIDEVGYGWVRLSWIMPAEDGYDAASGPVQGCGVTDDVEAYGGPYFGDCDLKDDTGTVLWGDPGERQHCVEVKMQPDTTYQLGVRCRDAALQWSEVAMFDPVTTLPYSFFQDPAWSIERLPFSVGDLIGTGVDNNGNAIVSGIRVTGRTKGRWKTELTAIRVATGVWDAPSNGWSWSYEDVQGYANSMLVDSMGSPVFAGFKDSVASNRRLEYTFHEGSAWATEVVAPDAGTFSDLPGFAFDAAGDPAIAWCYSSEGQPTSLRLARRGGPEQWDVQEVSSQVCDSGRVRLAFDGQGFPAVLYGREPSGKGWLARWTGSAWQEEPVEDPQGRPLWVDALLFDPWLGDFTVGAGSYWWMEACERTALGSWACGQPLDGINEGSEKSRVYTVLGGDFFLLDGTGEMLIAHQTFAELDVALARRLPGQPDWIIEHVDHVSTWGLDGTTDQQGPFPALGLLGQPTLAWTWDGVPYFAWK